MESMSSKKKVNKVTVRLTNTELEKIRLAGMSKSDFVRSKIGFDGGKEERLSESMQRFFDDVSTARRDILVMKDNIEQFTNNIGSLVGKMVDVLVEHSEKCDSAVAEYDQLGKVVIYLLSTILLTNPDSIKALKTADTHHVYDYAANLLKKNNPFEN